MSRTYPDPAAMYELLRDLVGAQAAAPTTPSPAVMQVIVAARRMIHDNEYGTGRRDAEGHDKVCRAAAAAFAGRPIGSQAACKHCGQDIEFHGRGTGWIDRGAGRSCLPFVRGGELVNPTTNHVPAQ